MLREDRIGIQHMLDAINEALTFTKGHQKDDLYQNRILVLSLIKEIEIIGEAASKVTEKTKTRYPQIPWKEMISIRNRLIHVYFDVDLERVCDTIQIDLPELKSLIEPILKSRI